MLRVGYSGSHGEVPRYHCRGAHIKLWRGLVHLLWWPADRRSHQVGGGSRSRRKTNDVRVARGAKKVDRPDPVRDDDVVGQANVGEVNQGINAVGRVGNANEL